jgi:hypothetical protein
MTFSADSTTHRNINYNSRHVNLKVEPYSTLDENVEKKHATRFFGISTPLDGSSKQSIKHWKELLNDITKIYNSSPLGKRTGNLL